MITNPKFDLMREWAATLAKEYAAHGKVGVREPSFPSGALTIDVDLDQTLAQALLWPSGMLEIRVVAIESGDEVVTENHEVKDADDLALVLRRVEAFVSTTQGAP